MGYSEILYESDSALLKQNYVINFNFRLVTMNEQKNWSPFEVTSAGSYTHEHKLLFIQSITPHRIVEPEPTGSKNHVYGQVVAETNYGNIKNITDIWKWGELRGGTPALFLEDSQFYLSFFHSSNDPPTTGDVLRTYVFGAYTFCSKPPYRILSMSSIPITHDSMFQGPWTNLPLSFYHIDYVSFPMSFIVDGDIIYLTYGKQDEDGWIAKVSKMGLLGSLTAVNSHC